MLSEIIYDTSIPKTNDKRHTTSLMCNHNHTPCDLGGIADALPRSKAGLSTTIQSNVYAIICFRTLHINCKSFYYNTVSSYSLFQELLL